MKLAPGSTPWLLRHDLRLVWRGGGMGRPMLWTGVGAVLWLAYHAAVWVMLDTVADVDAMPRTTFVWLGLMAWFVFTVIVAQAMNHAVAAFFERGDLDLLLASPLAPRRVLVVRGVGVAISSVATYLWLVAPFANVGAITGHPRLLSLYPAIAAQGLLAAALAMALTSAFVRVLGARRARTVTQWAGGLVGAAFFLLLQFENLVSPERAARFRAALRGSGGGGLPDRDSVAWLPLHAMSGEPLALLAVVALGVATFAWASSRMTRRFLAGAQESLATPMKPRAAATSLRFRSGLWRVVLVKEWKLIARDPQLVGQTLLQSLYMLPLMLVWLRSSSPQVVLAPTMVMLSATLASGLAWLTVAADDAPELIASAPVPRSLLRRAKLVAALAPVWAIALPLAFFLAVRDLAAAAVFAVCVVGATIAAAGIHLALSRAGRRRDLRRRGSGGFVVNALQFTTTIAWPALTWCLLQAPLFAPLPAVACVAAPLVAWWWGRRARRDAGAA